MTIVEFYDKVSLENIAGALLCNADKIVLIGDNRSRMEKSKHLYDSILQKRGIDTDISYISINRNNLQGIVDVLSRLVISDEELIFDLTGGDDLYLVAIGIIMNKYEGRVKCHRFNFYNDTLYDCDADGTVCATLPFFISAEENIAMYGGMIVTDTNKPLHTKIWNFDNELDADIETMWNICKRNAEIWNSRTNLLGFLCDSIDLDEGLSFSADDAVICAKLKKKKVSLSDFNRFLHEISNHGLINQLNTDVGTSFVFKNSDIKRCLTVSGQVLELLIANRMRNLCDEEGKPIYNQVLVGVCIDWDRSDDENRYRTINEIDILAMKGAIPVFISCKNGVFDENELYKLNTVAEHFGDKYAKKVIVSTRLDKFGLKSDYLRARMGDMKIRCIDNITNISDKQLNSMLEHLWLN